MQPIFAQSGLALSPLSKDIHLLDIKTAATYLLYVRSFSAVASYCLHNVTPGMLAICACVLLNTAILKHVNRSKQRVTENNPKHSSRQPYSHFPGIASLVAIAF